MSDNNKNADKDLKVSTGQSQRDLNKLEIASTQFAGGNKKISPKSKK